MAPRPRLASAVRPLGHPGGAVQLGVSPGSGAILLSGLTPGELAFLDRLDGRHTEAELDEAAHAVGVERRRAHELLALLRHHGVLASETRPPSVPSGRPRPLVVVDGAGPLATSVATLLRAAGVGRIESGPWAADTADAHLRMSEGDTPRLVVLVSDRDVDPRSGSPWRRRHVPHLPVVTDGDRVVVGPWISADPVSPCLECLRLTRMDPDAALTTVHTPTPPVEPVDHALIAMGAGMTAMVVRAGLGDARLPAGVSVEVRAPWPRVDHRRWERHPDCSSHGSGVHHLRVSG
jgi:hypothetical protein